MFVVCVTVWVKPGYEEQFIEATGANHLGTRKEAGNLRFDVLRSREDPSQFFLYEAYRSEDDFTRHQQTAHYLAWKKTVEDWMARKRQGVKHDSILPGDGGW